MREAPGPIPSTLPSTTDACRKIKAAVDRSNTRLADLSLAKLVTYEHGGEPAWLTGSTVWMPAVFGQEPDREGDFDVVFSSRAATKAFSDRAVAELNQRAPRGKRFTTATNKLGGTRICHPDGEGVIDAWHLEEGESIAELVMAYPTHTGVHIRCAYLLTGAADPSSLLRIVRSLDSRKTTYPRPDSGDVQTSPYGNIFKNLEKAKIAPSSYPGKKKR